MDHGWSVVIGMSIAYVASFAGMLFAYLAYRRRKRQQPKAEEEDV